MKKYIAPESHVIEMETTTVLAQSSLSITKTTTTDEAVISSESQKRTGIDWDKYYNYGE